MINQCSISDTLYDYALSNSKITIKNKHADSSLNNLKVLNLHKHCSCQIHKSTRQPNR